MSRHQPHARTKTKELLNKHRAIKHRSVKRAEPLKPQPNNHTVRHAQKKQDALALAAAAVEAARAAEAAAEEAALVAEIAAEEAK